MPPLPPAKDHRSPRGRTRHLSRTRCRAQAWSHRRARRCAAERGSCLRHVSRSALPAHRARPPTLACSRRAAGVRPPPHAATVAPSLAAVHCICGEEIADRRSQWRRWHGAQMTHPGSSSFVPYSPMLLYAHARVRVRVCACACSHVRMCMCVHVRVLVCMRVHASDTVLREDVGYRKAA